MEDLYNNGALRNAWIPLEGVESGELKTSADLDTDLEYDRYPFFSYTDTDTDTDILSEMQIPIPIPILGFDV